MAAVLLVLLLGTLCSCAKTKEDLKFYVVSGSAIHAEMTDAQLLAAAKKKGRVAFTGADLKGWLWPTQQVQLQAVGALGNAGDGGSALFQAQAGDAFVLTLGSRILYAGGFKPGSGTTAVRNPYIEDESGAVFAIVYDRQYGAGEDPRANTALYDYLTDQQLLVTKIQ